jgi:hypothetical protein
MFLDNNSFEVIVRERDGYINVSKMVIRYTEKKIFDCVRNKQFKEELTEIQKIRMFFFWTRIRAYDFFF